MQSTYGQHPVNTNSEREHNMYLLIFGGMIWGMIARSRSAKQRKAEERRAAQIARINAENAKRKAEIARIKANAKAETARMVAIEREQMRQAKEQAKQAAMLAKHEEEIEKLKFRMARAESDIEHFTEQLGNLYALLDIEEMARSSAVPGSAEDAKHQRKIITLTNQIHTAETRLEKAKFNKEQAERKIA